MIGRRDYDTAEVRAANAREALKAAEHGGRPEDVASAAAAVDQQERRLAYLERQRRELEVDRPGRRPRSSRSTCAPATSWRANQPVATLLEPDQIWVRVYVPEPQLGYVGVGQAGAALRSTRSPRRTFAGKRGRDPPPGGVHAAQHADARPAQRPGVRRQGGDRARLRRSRPAWRRWSPCRAAGGGRPRPAGRWRRAPEPRSRHRGARACRATSVRCTRSPTSRCRCRAARSTACWGRTARASRR